MEYILHIVIMLNIYILLVLSANLPIGMANLLSMCQAAFYGIGAYISAYFLMQFDLPFIVVVAIIMFTTGLFSYVVSFASVKLKGDYFILPSLGFQMIVYTILYNWTDVTRGPYGSWYSRYKDTWDMESSGCLGILYFDNSGLFGSNLCVPENKILALWKSFESDAVG